MKEIRGKDVEHFSKKDTRKKGFVDISKDESSRKITDKSRIDGRHVEYEGRDLEVKLKKEGIVLIQLQPSNNINLTMGNNHYSMINKEESTELHGPKMHFSMEEIGSNRRRITTHSYPQGFQTIEMGEDNREATIGNINLKHRDDGGLDIGIKPENAKETGEKEKITIKGYGNDRTMIYEYGDEHTSTNFKVNIDSVNNSKKETSAAIKENIIKDEVKRFGLLYGATRRIVLMIPQVIPREGVSVGA